MRSEPIATDDLARLRAARPDAAVDPTRSLFGPESITWRVNREATLLAGGGRALLLQIAHPLVAAGVEAYSDFRAHPLRRLWRTLDLMLTIVFADGAEALGAVRAIERVHARVRGVLATDLGPFPRGTPYDAGDPTLLLWVHATLVDSAMLVYDRFVAPLDPGARAAYYDESRVVARLLGIPDRVVPADLGAFEEYVESMISGPVLTVGSAAREIAAAIFRPAVPIVLRPAFVVSPFLTAGLLPARIRERYGLAWSPTRERALAATAAVTRALLPTVPAALRFMPHARRAAAALQMTRQMS